MAGMSGFSGTLAGGTTGSITGIESISIGGLTLSHDLIRTIGDTNRVGEHLPMGVEEGNLEVVVNWNKTIYNACRNAVLGQTSETWTLTDAGSSTHIGTGYLTSVGAVELGTGAHATFRLTITPATKWAFTA